MVNRLTGLFARLTGSAAHVITITNETVQQTASQIVASEAASAVIYPHIAPDSQRDDPPFARAVQCRITLALQGEISAFANRH